MSDTLTFLSSIGDWDVQAQHLLAVSDVADDHKRTVSTDFNDLLGLLATEAEVGGLCVCDCVCLCVIVVRAIDG